MISTPAIAKETVDESCQRRGGGSSLARACELFLVRSEEEKRKKKTLNLLSLFPLLSSPLLFSILHQPNHSIEYNISYVYHAMYAYFSRDNVALPGFASYFKNESVEERHHAELLMDFQNRRGGRVKFQSILMPEMEFHDATKGDALYAMELALSLEKLNFSKLRALHSVADAAGDANMCDFVEGELLDDQAKAVEKVANYVAQLRRVGPGLGVFEFDRKLAA